MNYANENQGKRTDQIEFSIWVAKLSFLLLSALVIGKLLFKLTGL